MPKGKSTGPRSFGEWVVGTSIPSVLGPMPKRNRRRDVVRVEISTDDESEEDTIKISYPSSSSLRSWKSTSSGSAKKVRFEGVPHKSAMKKREEKKKKKKRKQKTKEKKQRRSSGYESDTSSADCSDSDESSKSASSAKSSGSSKKTRQKNKDVEGQSREESDIDLDPHPTCKCRSCIEGRKELARRSKQGKNKTCNKQSSDSEGDDSEEWKSSGKKDKKRGKKGGEGGSDSETEEEDDGCGQEKDVDAKKGDNGKKKGRKGGRLGEAKQSDNKKAKNKNKDANEKKSPSRKDGKDDKKNERDSRQPGKGDDQKDYPEAFPLPHPRRPNLIEPIRAEVVQTERVIETPQDPPPNAYYDAAHNIVRVYHGPVYGGNHSHSLYPQRDSSCRPLPLGSVHPTQNPYFYGFNQPPPQPHGYDHGPLQHGLWGPFYSHAKGGPTGVWDGAGAGLNKGAFSAPAGVGPPSSKDKDMAGENNVMPGSLQGESEPNPYYQKRPRSQFSGFGSNRSHSEGGRNGQGSDRGFGYPGNDGARDSSGKQGSDYRASTSQDAWRRDTSQNETAWGEGNDGSYNSDQNGNGWNANGNGSTDAKETGWDNSGGGQSNENDFDNQNHSAGVQDQAPSTENNVMPGTWDTSVPAWGDASMAASTGGGQW